MMHLIFIQIIVLLLIILISALSKSNEIGKAEYEEYLRNLDETFNKIFHERPEVFNLDDN